MKAIVIAQPTKRKRLEPSPAWRLYQGSQQQLVQQGLESVWHSWGFRQCIDEVILSPWHGPCEPEQMLYPYDFTWKGRPAFEVDDHVSRTAVIERLQERIEGFDLVLVLLSKVYLRPLRLPTWVPERAPQRWLFYASGEGLPFVPPGPNVRIVPAGTPEARREGVKVLDLKAHLFRRLCLDASHRGPQALEAAWETAATRA